MHNQKSFGTETVSSSGASSDARASEHASTGALYLVATPIGNLEDMTYRAVRVLGEVGLIAAEDTRQTRKLLTHFDIHTRLVSYHEHNKQASGKELVRLMAEGVSIALVSDAGLPAIADPGAELVRDAIEAGLSVIPVPGANAALASLIASGLPTDRFLFAGFPPRERKSLLRWLEPLKQQAGTLLFYESPHRVIKTLEVMREVLGNRRVVLARELTKRHEEWVRGSMEEALAWLAEHPPLGEFCIVVEGLALDAKGIPQTVAVDGEEQWWSGLGLGAHVAHYETLLANRKEAMKRAAADRGMSKREVYNQLIDEDT